MSGNIEKAENTKDERKKKFGKMKTQMMQNEGFVYLLLPTPPTLSTTNRPNKTPLKPTEQLE